MTIRFTIRGQLYSMKNSRIASRRSRFPVKHPKAQRFAQDFGLQVPAQYRDLQLDGSLRAIVTVFYPSRRQDLDCALLYDLLQKAGVVKNDRSIIEKHEFAEVDKQNPRVELTLEEV